METFAQAIERALAALLDADYESALAAVIEAWRAYRAPALVALIDGLSAHVSRSLTALSTDADDWQSVWQERARRRRFIDIPALLPLAIASPKAEIHWRIRLLLDYGPDPRVGRFLLEMIETPPTTASANFGMWADVFHVLPAYVDASVAGRLAARAAAPAGTSQFWPKLERWIADAIPRLPAPVPSDPIELQTPALARLQALVEELRAGPAPDIDEASAAGLDADWSVPKSLAPALEHLDENRLTQALDSMVWFWSRHRAPALADAIDRLGGLIAPGQPILSAGSRRAFHDKWMAAGNAPRPTAIGRLLEYLRDGTLYQVEARLEAMLRWCPDPRVAHAMMLMTKDHTLSARNRMWAAVYDVLVHHADPRVLDRLLERHIESRSSHRRRVEGRHSDRTIDAFEAACRDSKALEPADEERVVAIAQQLQELVDAELDGDDAARIEKRLVAAIVADYEVDSPRLVYADWLQQRGDPRGEFIALDIQLARGKRVKGRRDRYYKTHRQELLGPIAPLIGSGEQFERGLLHRARVTLTRGKTEVPGDQRDAMIGDMRWATLRECHLFGIASAGDFLASAPLSSLHRLEGVMLDGFLKLAQRATPIPLRFVRLSAGDDQPWAELAQLTRVLPHLREMALVIHVGDERAERVTPPLEFFHSPLVRQLDRLRNGDAATAGIPRLDEWLQRMAEAACPVRHLQAIGAHLSADVYSLDDRAYTVHVRVANLRADNEADCFAVSDILRALPVDLISTMTIEFDEVDRTVELVLAHALKHLPVSAGL